MFFGELTIARIPSHKFQMENVWFTINNNNTNHKKDDLLQEKDG